MSHYEQFKQLHNRGSALVLANAWNVKSAQIAETKGFDAIGTSSGAIADSLGYPDGEKIPFSEMLYIVRRMRSATNIPMSVDMERGYTDDLDQLNTHIQLLLDAGVAGINIEDAQGEEIYLAKLRSIKSFLKKTNQSLFINARTDVFLQKLNSPLETTLKRAAIYQNAGAHGLFVTGIQDTDIIQKITSGTTLPVNVVATPKLTSIKMLENCGVKRVSMAAFLYRASYRQMESIAEQIITDKSFSSLH